MNLFYMKLAHQYLKGDYDTQKVDGLDRWCDTDGDKLIAE